MSENAKEVLIKPRYNPDFVAEMRGIKGRRWNPQERAWSIPASYEFRIRKLAKRHFPPKDSDAWKEETADQIRGLVLFYLPPGIGVVSEVVDELDGSTTVSMRREDARDKLEEVNVVVEDEWRLRESVNDDEAEYLAEKLYERQSCWLDFNSKPKPRHTLPPP